jgi:hypothetical protein
VPLLRIENNRPAPSKSLHSLRYPGSSNSFSLIKIYAGTFRSSYENRSIGSNTTAWDRRVFGTKREEVAGGWRSLHNLYASQSVIGVIREDEKNEACGKHGRGKKCVQNFG